MPPSGGSGVRTDLTRRLVLCLPRGAGVGPRGAKAPRGIGSGGQGAGGRLGEGYTAGPGRPAPKSSVLIEAWAKVGARNGIGGLV